MTPHQSAMRLRRMARRLPTAADRAMREWARWAYGLALTYSSGRVRQAVFDAPFGSEYGGRPGAYFRLSNYHHGATMGLGHPYGYGATGSLGQRGPIPYGDPAKINVQSGEFFRGWKVVKTANGWSLDNDSPHARDLLMGTSKMIARPFLNRIADHARGRARYYGAYALMDALN